MPTEMKGIQDETFLPTLSWEFITWNWNFVPKTGQDTHTQTTNQPTKQQQQQNRKREKEKERKKLKNQ